jgi:hypothetical protein
MLRMTFTPPGGQQRVFEMVRVDDEISALEAELIEDAGGRQWDTFMGFALQMSQGSFRAVRVLLWVFLRREDPGLELAALDFPVSALQFEDTGDEPEPGKDEPAAAATSSP